jgi:hypothetical protein
MSHPFRPQREPLVPPGEIEHHITDLTVTASADVALERLQQRLSENDQWLPVDGNPSRSLGELVETNSTGPLRLGFGAWRDLLLGVQFTVKSGPLITAGGRTMKNVAGYDLTKFMVGQYGLFGKLATVTTRTWKRPSHALRVSFATEKRIDQFLTTAVRPQWAMITAHAQFCGYLGDERSIDFIQGQLAEHQPLDVVRQSAEQDIEFRARHWLPPRPAVRFRASVPPARAIEFKTQAYVREWAADPIFGVIVGSCPSDHVPALRRWAEQLGGSVLFDDPQELQRLFDADRPESRLLRRLQSAFNE